MLFVRELLHRRASHRNNGNPHQSFGIDGSNSVPESFPAQRSRRRRFKVSRYFFHVKRGQVTVLDQEGIDLANPTQVEEEAARRAQQCSADDALNGMPVSSVISIGMIIVADENWHRLFELPF